MSRWVRTWAAQEDDGEVNGKVAIKRLMEPTPAEKCTTTAQ